jgi:hypothetical protein
VVLFFIRHQRGGQSKLAPYTEDGVNHFITCPKADQFRRAKQDELFDVGKPREYPG